MDGRIVFRPENVCTDSTSLQHQRSIKGGYENTPWPHHKKITDLLLAAHKLKEEAHCSFGSTSWSPERGSTRARSREDWRRSCLVLDQRWDASTVPEHWVGSRQR